MSKSCSKQLIWLFAASLWLSGCSIFTPSHITANLSRERQFRQEIVEYAKKYLGLPYRYASRNPEVGFDCSGFTHFVMRNFNVALSTSSSAQATQGVPIPVSEAQTGDLIVFRHSPRGRVFHVAMVVANDAEGLRIIHSTYRGVIIDNVGQSSYWRRKIKSARRVVTLAQVQAVASL